jgi:hypothetical protein
LNGESKKERKKISKAVYKERSSIVVAGNKNNTVHK